MSIDQTQDAHAATHIDLSVRDRDIAMSESNVRPYQHYSMVQSQNFPANSNGQQNSDFNYPDGN